MRFGRVYKITVKSSKMVETASAFLSQNILQNLQNFGEAFCYEVDWPSSFTLVIIQTTVGVLELLGENISPPILMIAVGMSSPPLRTPATLRTFILRYTLTFYALKYNYATVTPALSPNFSAAAAASPAATKRRSHWLLLLLLLLSPRSG